MVLDLSGLEFLDCSGLRFIAKLTGRLQSEQRRLILLTVRSIVRRVIDVTDLSDHPNLRIVDRYPRLIRSAPPQAPDGFNLPNQKERLAAGCRAT